MEDNIDLLNLVIAGGACRKCAEVLHDLAWDERRMLFPRLITAEEEITVVALKVAALADFENDVQVLEFHRSTLGKRTRSHSPNQQRGLLKGEFLRDLGLEVDDDFVEVDVDADGATGNRVDVSIDQFLCAFEIGIVSYAIVDLFFQFGHLSFFLSDLIAALSRRLRLDSDGWAKPVTRKRIIFRNPA